MEAPKRSALPGMTRWNNPPYRPDADRRLREWLQLTCPASHAAVINLKPEFRQACSGIDWTRQIYSDFLKKFNRAIYGRHIAGKRIGQVAFIHRRKNLDEPHLHIAFWGLPLRLSDEQLKAKFLSAAQHTAGVMATHADGSAAAYFERLTGSWLSYSSRFFGWDGEGDFEDFMLDQATAPISNGIALSETSPQWAVGFPGPATGGASWADSARA